MRTHCPGYELFASLFKCRGSVIPRALFFALPSATLALAMKLFEGEIPEEAVTFDILLNNAAYTGFSFAMGFLFVFRTSQAYSRFWEGVTVGQRMYAEWLDFASGVVAFSKYSKAGEEVTSNYHHRLVRLLSLLHAAGLASLRGLDGSQFEILDIDGLEEEVVERALMSKHPVTLIGQWLMELVMEGIEDHILAAPPPIVSRAFQEFAQGMLAYHDAVKIQSTKFPFPYTQMSTLMLMAHWIITPFIMCQWVVLSSWVFFLTLIQVAIFWCLYFTAIDIEMPFKRGKLNENHAGSKLQKHFNEQLLILIDSTTRRLPILSPEAQLDVTTLSEQHNFEDLMERKSHTMTKKHATSKNTNLKQVIGGLIGSSEVDKSESTQPRNFKKQITKSFEEEKSLDKAVSFAVRCSALSQPEQDAALDKTVWEALPADSLTRIADGKDDDGLKSATMSSTMSAAIQSTNSQWTVVNRSESAWTVCHQATNAATASAGDPSVISEEQLARNAAERVHRTSAREEGIIRASQPNGNGYRHAMKASL